MIDQSDIEKIVENTILLLKALSEGQGYASIEVFDTGAGGGFSSGRVIVEHLRDGKFIKQDVYESPQQLKDLIIDILKSTDSGLPERILINSNWNEYTLDLSEEQS